MDLDNFIKENFSYFPDTGYISTKLKKCSFSFMYPNGKRYLRIKLKNTQILAHRMAWFLYYGLWPENNIDHINGDGSDNRIENLRDVSHSENQKNRRLSSNNKTGITGVYVYRNRFRVQIKNKRDKYYLGSFNDFFEACCVRKSAENKFGFHKNHGIARPL